MFFFFMHKSKLRYRIFQVQILQYFLLRKYCEVCLSLNWYTILNWHTFPTNTSRARHYLSRWIRTHQCGLISQVHGFESCSMLIFFFSFFIFNSGSSVSFKFAFPISKVLINDWLGTQPRSFQFRVSCTKTFLPLR